MDRCILTEIIAPKNSSKIEQLKKQIADLEEEDNAYDSLTSEEKLAITLHEKLCHQNHTDGCGWWYEMIKVGDNKYNHDWHGSSHERWMNKAEKAHACCDHHKIPDEVIVQLVDILNEF